MFGIAGYSPQWQRGITTIRNTHAARLHSLINRKLTQIWLAWNTANDEWWSDYPVLLDFEGTQLEICHQKFDDLSLTWNTIDPRTPLALPAAWRNDADPRITPLLNQPLHSVDLVEWTPVSTDPNLATGMVEPTFTFPTATLTISNALDENALSFTTVPNYRHHDGNSRSTAIRQAELGTAPNKQQAAEIRRAVLRMPLDEPDGVDIAAEIARDRENDHG